MQFIRDLLNLLFQVPKERCEGDDAYYRGCSEDFNPYPKGTAAHEEWRRGFFRREA